jgi:hypothetical protein
MDELSLGNALALLPWHPGGRPVSRAERLTWIGRCESGLDGGHARGVTTRSESAGSLTLATRGEVSEAALVGPSTLASAYRATTHFTPRDGGWARPRMVTITGLLIRVSDL